MPRSKGRAGRPWRRLTRRLREGPGGDVCWLCDGVIDLSLPRTHRMSWTADHVDPISLGGAPRDASLLRPAHRACNSSRGNRMSVKVRRQGVQTSESW